MGLYGSVQARTGLTQACLRHNSRFPKFKIPSKLLNNLVGPVGLEPTTNRL
jgi:hypothetical protein